jgi:DNA repair protein RadD
VVRRDRRQLRRATPSPASRLRCASPIECGLAGHSEWVCLEHTGYPRQRAEAWWRRRTDAPIPATVAEAIAGTPELREPVAIQVRPVGQYTEIVAVRFG